MIENEIPADGLSLTRSQSTPRELESIYRTRFDRFHSVATAITGDPERGRDAVQEAFANALAHRTEPRHHEALEAWLWQTVINAARDERRRANRRRSREDHGGDAEAIPAAPPADRGDQIRSLISSLPERQRLALFLRYYADLDYAAIAEALSIRLGTVGPTLNHAHAALRTLLEES